MNDIFRILSHKVANATGRAQAFIIALSLIAIWGLTGPYFNYSDTWQLVINTTTTIVTFLMVFLIQNTQNRDAKATQLKLDELLRSIRGARNDMIDLEDLSDNDLEALHLQFQKLHERYAKEALRRKMIKEEKEKNKQTPKAF